MNLDDIGLATIKDSTAFKKIQYFSKTNPSPLYTLKSDFQNTFDKFGRLYNNDLDLNLSYNYGMDRQHNYVPLSSSLPFNHTLLDNKGVEKLFNYNFNNLNFKSLPKNNLSLNRFSYGGVSKTPNSYTVESNISNYFKLLPSIQNNLDFFYFIKTPNLFSIITSENDSKQFSNTFKYTLNFKHKKKSLYNFQYMFTDYVDSTLYIGDPFNKFCTTLSNSENLLKFKDPKSSNLQFLGSERTVRLLNNVNSDLYKRNLTSSPNLVSGVLNNISSYGKTQKDLYGISVSNWDNLDKFTRFSNNIIHMPAHHTPIMSSNIYHTNTSFDFFNKGYDDITPMVLRSKEESAPPYVFNTYWSTY